MGRPTLLFCVGATKAGTSWLHRFVADHMRGLKELHYFDAAEFDEWKFWADAAAARRDRARTDVDQSAAKARVAQDADDWCRVLAAGQEDDAAYLDYLQTGRGEAELVGDFTPAYGLLPERTLRRMAGLLPDVRFIYLLRDPVARIWSHVRMMAGRQTGSPDQVPGHCVKLVKRILNGQEPQIVRRSDYIGPVTRLRAAVSPDKLHFGFYEELFAQGPIAKICAFLGIEPRAADFDQRVMQGPRAEMAPGQWNDMRDYLAPQYDAMRTMFGRLPDAWDMKPVKV